MPSPSSQHQQHQSGIFHIYPNQQLISKQQKRRNLFRRFREAFVRVQSNGVITLNQNFIDLDRRINDNNFEVDGWGFRAFWHSVGLTENEMEFFFQECAAISAAQLGGNTRNQNNNNTSSLIEDIQAGIITSRSNDNSISVDLAEAAVYVRRSFDCRRQQLHDILKRLRSRKPHPRKCPFATSYYKNRSSSSSSAKNCSRLVIFDYLTKEGDLSHSEAFLLMDACSTPRFSSEEQNKNQKGHNIGTGSFHPNSSNFHQPSLASTIAPSPQMLMNPTSPVNQTNTKDSELDIELLTSCIFVFPLPDSVAFSLLLGKVVDSLCDSFRGSGPTGVTAIVHACAKLVTRTSPEEVEEWLRGNSHHHSDDHDYSDNNNNNNNNFDIRLNVEEFVNICSNAIAAGMPHGEAILLHSFLADDEAREKRELKGGGRGHLSGDYDDQEFYDDDEDNHQSASSSSPTLSLKKFVTAINDRIPLLSDEVSFDTAVAETRHHILATRGGFSALFHFLVKTARQTGHVLDRAGVIGALRSINVSPAAVPDITIERIVSYFLVHHQHANIGLGPSLQTVTLDQIRNHRGHHHSCSSSSNSSSTIVTLYIRSFIEVLRGKVSLNRMEIVEKLYHRLTDGVLVPKIKMLSSVPTSYTSSHLTDNFETTRENRRRAIASLLDEDEFEIVMGEIDGEELARRRQIRETALYQKLLRASDFLMCFAPDLVHGGGGSQQNKLQKTAVRCQRELVAYLKTLDRLSFAVDSHHHNGSGDDDEDQDDDVALDEYYYSNENNFRTADFPVDSPLMLSLAEFGFFWANFAMTVVDDAEFTILLWEGFSMHKALSSTNDQKAFGGNSTTATPRKHHNNHQQQHVHRRNIQTAQDEEEYYRQQQQQNQNQQEHNQDDNTPQSPPSTSIAALIAASHEEERKRRQHRERLAAAAWSNNSSPQQTKATGANSSFSTANSSSNLALTPRRSGNHQNNNNSTPRYHHHYHHPHAHEQQEQEDHDDQNSNFLDKNNYNNRQKSTRTSPHHRDPNTGAIIWDDTPLDHQDLNQTVFVQSTSKGQRARNIVDRSADVVADYERRQKERQEKYLQWEKSSANSASFKPHLSGSGQEESVLDDQDGNNQRKGRNETPRRGRKAVMTHDALGQTVKNVVVDDDDQNNNNNVSPSGSFHQDEEERPPQHHHKEGEVVGYTEDGRPIVLQRVIADSAEGDQHHRQHQQHGHSPENNEYDFEEQNFGYNNDDDDHVQENHDTSSISPASSSRQQHYRPDLAEAVPLMENRYQQQNENSQQQQQQQNRVNHHQSSTFSEENSAERKRKRVLTPLEIYKAGEEKLNRDIEAFHHRRPASASLSSRKQQHRNRNDDITPKLTSENVVLNSRRRQHNENNSHFSSASSARSGQQQQQQQEKEDRQSTRGANYQGFLPSFGVPGLSWNGNPKIEKIQPDFEEDNNNFDSGDHNHQNEQCVKPTFARASSAITSRTPNKVRRPVSASASEAARRNLRTTAEVLDEEEAKRKEQQRQQQQKSLENAKREEEEEYYRNQRTKHDPLHPEFSRKKFIRPLRKTTIADEIKTIDDDE